ncbi:MAG: alpha-L-rhamnosidase N-terminal domain-containing protein, partial [Bacilli bacterium]|nr:alpha-L-rhamnosidase N-terminal domain-containing protein [Bacilli bacterium]
MIYSLKTNDQINPYGIIDDISYSFIATKGNRFEFVLSDDIEFHNLLIKKEVLLDNANHFKADCKYEKGHHYFWKMIREEEESEVVTFFVADDLDASFITPKEDITHPVFFKEFDSNNIKEARLVVTGLGLYQCYLNGNKIDHGYLNPGFNDYDDYLRYQEIDITSLIKEQNKLEVIVGDGIYKGRMGFDNHPGEIWGSKYLLCAKVILIKNDGTREEILTDTSW